MQRKHKKPLMAAFMCLVMVLAQILPIVPCGPGGGKMDNAMLAQAAVTEEEEKLEHPKREPEALRQAATSTPESTPEPTPFPGARGVSGRLGWSITADGVLTISGSGDYDHNGGPMPKWLQYKEYITKAIVVDVKNITSTYCLFEGCERLTEIDLSGLDTSKVTNMYCMFSGCTGLTSIDLSGLDTGNVTNMAYMFYSCTGLTEIDLSGFNISKVSSMEGMFCNCTGLTSIINISGLDTYNVMYMDEMFGNCTGLTEIDVSGFDTSNVRYMQYMFYGCKGLTEINVSGFDTSDVRDMDYMFADCTGLTSIDVSKFSARGLYSNFTNMFLNCSSLEILYFFCSDYRYANLPSVQGYYWVNENGDRCEKTAILDHTMTYLRGKEGEPAPTFVPTPSPVPTLGPTFAPTTEPVPTLGPTSAPTTEPAPTLTPSSSPSSTQTPAIDDVNSGIYPDSSMTSLATLAERTQFVNGGNVKQADNTKINYKAKVFYTNIQASDIVTTDKKGKTKTKKGKLVAGITTTASRPVLDKNRIKDAAASNIATASISKGKIKVTAKKEAGVVYLWVIDTGDAGACACAKFVIKAAPTKLQLFRNPSSAADFSADKKNLYKKDSVEIGGSAKLYLYPTYKKGTAMEETKDCTYSISVAEKAQEYFTAVQDASAPYCFTVTAKGLKDNKKVSGKITVQCNENGKKVSFTATALNSVQGISTGLVSGLADNTVSGAAVASFLITRSDTEKTTGSFTLATELSSSSYETTDKPKLYAMASEDGFDKEQMDKGKVKVTSRPSGDQGKIKAKLGKDKKMVTVTAAKKIPAGTSVYYLAVYNTKEGKGYKVIKFTAA